MKGGEKVVLAFLLLFLPLLLALPEIAMVCAAPFIIFGGTGVITGAMAARKGYRFACWWFALSLLGLLFVAFLPDLSKIAYPKAAETLKKKGNDLGFQLSMATILMSFLLLLGFGLYLLSMFSKLNWHE